jgi:hypothetical protein
MQGNVHSSTLAPRLITRNRRVTRERLTIPGRALALSREASASRPSNGRAVPG